MKKFLFWTALASVALTGCVKNDVEPNPSLGQDVEITFNQPVVGKITKAYQAGLMDTDYKQEEKFAVTAWAHEKDFQADDAEIKPYFDKVMAYYKPSATATPNVGTDTGTGGWVLANPYYWPKTHKLTFSAYSPYELPGVTEASVTVDNGITLKGVTTPDLVADHYDMLFSTRVYNQKEADYDHSNVDYIGVDIEFNHALSAIVVKACLDKTYADNNAIKINSIKFDNVMTVGDFYENITDYKSLTGKSTDAYWNNQGIAKDNFYIGQYTTANLPATATNAITYGTPAMFIPQELVNSEGNIQMVVNYTITNTGGYSLNETLTFDLSDLQDNSVTEWQIGKRYIYTLTFSLNEIVLAPAVDNWDDVDVSVLDDEDQILP